VPTVRPTKIDPESKVLVHFTKKEAMRKVKLSPNIESLQMDINVLKTITIKIITSQSRLGISHKAVDL